MPKMGISPIETPFKRPLLDIPGLLAWFAHNKRSLPWREDPTPYRVWISEVMLQQTQATTVIPYFLLWMDRFPTLESLANASIEEVIKSWEGLGYYSRAKNLHRAARYFHENHKGEIPHNEEALLKAPGFGPYTAAAVSALAFQQPLIAIDANVARVFTRFFHIQEPIDKPSTLIKLRAYVPPPTPYRLAEALIELGALICKKKPNCSKCPIQQGCLAFKENTTHLLPCKTPRPLTQKLLRWVAIFLYNNHILVRKVPEGEIMAGLYEFPYHEEETSKPFYPHIKLFTALAIQHHSFTKYRIELRPRLYKVDALQTPSHHQWVAMKQLTHLPFSSGHRRIAQQLIAHYL